MTGIEPQPPAKPPAGWISEDRYQILVESIDAGFCVAHVVFDPQGRAVDYVFLETNGTFERQTGLHDAVGRSINTMAPGHEEHWFRNFGEVATTGMPIRFEAPARSLGRWYDVYAFRVGEPRDCLVAILFTDITHRKELERSVESQNEALREADLRKDRFLATLSHELRNPLAPLKVAADLLGRAGLSETQLTQTRDIIRRQVTQMASLLDDLLDISRITQGKLALRRRHVAPTELIDGAVESVRPLIERKQHVLDIELDPRVPVVEVDPARMSQVVANLLANAAKYTDPGGRIRLATRVEDRELVIEVTDTGIGIPTEVLPGLFEMFSQQNTAAERSEGGLGIGLALVKGLVELHGGTVRAESEGAGRGSRFTVRLPLSNTVVGNEAPAGPTQASQEARRILLADDNRDAAESLAMLLTHFGHDVRVAFDGHDALSATRAFRPDIAILDIGMPKMNGYDLARALRAEPWAASLVLVAATGWGDAEARRLAEEAGFDLHLTKPIGPDELQQAIGIQKTGKTRTGASPVPGTGQVRDRYGTGPGSA